MPIRSKERRLILAEGVTFVLHYFKIFINLPKEIFVAVILQFFPGS